MAYQQRSKKFFDKIGLFKNEQPRPESIVSSSKVNQSHILPKHTSQMGGMGEVKENKSMVGMRDNLNSSMYSDHSNSSDIGGPANEENVITDALPTFGGTSAEVSSEPKSSEK
jgi:hypothetical protein